MLERIRRPDATIRIFRQKPPVYTGEFDEIDDDIGWYGGLTWQLPDSLGKLSVIRYDNLADPACVPAATPAGTHASGASAPSTQCDNFILIAQHMAG